MRTLLTFVLAGCAAATAGAAEPAASVSSLPADLSASLERVRLPGGEPMGLIGTSLVFELAPGWWVGPALYGAATGHRGGLFTWGVEGQHRWQLAPRWQLGAGLYVGGGGGAAAPVGGGLMLRPHAELMFDFGAWSAGVTASQVRFPSGTIRSSQLGLQVSVHDAFAFAEPGHDGQSLAFAGAGGLGLQRFSVQLGRYGASGSRAGFDTVGVRAERPAGRWLATTLEAAGAAKGGASGYAEFGAGLLALWPADARVRVGLHGALGLAGGGGVATGGGTFAKLGAVGRLALGRDATLELEAGRVRAFTGDFSARYVQLAVGVALGAPTPAGTPAPSFKTVHDTEWALSVEHYVRAQRKTGGAPSLDAIGLEVRRSIGGGLYAGGRALSAMRGGAGAYSVGLIGLGAGTRFGADRAWSAGAEAMVGAAGGGGVDSSGGAIVQPMAWAGRRMGRFGSLKLALGYVKSLHGGLATPVVDLAWAVDFGTP